MSTLNAAASRAAVALGLRCATDVTGFGLLGHASHIAGASDVTLRIESGRVPLLPGTLASLAERTTTGGAARNAEYLASLVDFGRISDDVRAILVDPQTSGGLLVAVPPALVDGYLSRVAGALVIGCVLPRGTHAIVVA